VKNVGWLIIGRYKVIIIFIGPPGSGKGTQSKLLSKELKIPHISTGDILRDHISKNTPIGKNIKKLLDAGQFAPNEITNTIIENKLKEKDCKNGFILDGYPRNIEQAIFFSSLYTPDYVIYLKISNDEIINRLKLRASLEKRTDDADENLILERIRIFNKETRPIIKFYENQNKLFTVNSTEIEDVFNEIKNLIEE